MKKVTGGYNTEGYILECTISNTNLTGYDPSLTLTSPTGFNFLEAEGDGTFTNVNARTITWDPKLTNKRGSSTAQFKFNVNVTFPSGVDTYTGTFTLVESLNTTTKNFTATITTRPSSGETPGGDAPPVIDDSTTLDYIQAVEDEEVLLELPSVRYMIAFCFPIDGNNELLFLEKDTPAMYTDGTIDPDEEDEYIWYILTDYVSSSDEYTTEPLDYPDEKSYQKFVFYNPGRYALIFFEPKGGVPPYAEYSTYAEDEPVGMFYFEVKPKKSKLQSIHYSILEIGEEELNRLGDGYTYIVQSDMKHITDDDYPRDWYKNNRIGVFNNDIENVDDYTNLDEGDIFANALYWSESFAGLNAYSNVECEFKYDSDYPLYIIITGDYYRTISYGFDMGSIKYNEPCIIEKEVYSSRESNGTYPVPILDLLDNSDTSTLLLNDNQSSNSVILYGLGLEDDFGTNEDYAIRGVQVRANIEYTDNLVMYAKLHNPNGEIGQRSIVLDSTDEEIIIGGLGDLWGFTTLQMTKLNDWQLELTTVNILTNTESTILYNDVSIVFFLEQVEKQEVSAKIEGENLAYYAAFIESIQIPEGLETDTSFLTIDGTDTNDAYRQNIREKTITIEFNIDTCDIQTSTDMLRQLTKLFVNEKDQYNRPIPKRIEFSHYPYDYFEYILEKPFDVETDVTGFNVKAQLTIPAGTSYSLEDSVTNTVGNANGLAAVNPIIRFRPSDTDIQINETFSNQSFNMAYNGGWNNYIVEIDCEDRKVYLVQSADTRIDISKYVDHNSDWFRLSGEFAFDSVNCTILSISFNERW